MRIRVLCAFVLFLLCASAANADVVRPSDDVVTGVVVRASASSSSAVVGTLRPGDEAELLGSVPNWHRVRLSNGLAGFVSKRWTRVIPEGAPVTTNAYTIDVVDVGTGLAVMVRGSDFTLVYDGGSNDDLARGDNNRMVAYMKTAAPTLSTIDHVILSHPHRDHVELLPDVFDEYQVRQVWDSGRVNDICGYRAFLTAVRDEPGVQYHNALHDFGAHDYSFTAKTCYGSALPAEEVQLTHAARISETAIPLGQGASMTILHADGGDHPSANENTLVVRVDLGTTRVLLMGDAEAGGRKSPSEPAAPGSIEGSLLACCTGDLAARIMIVGHHGSRTSSRRSFLDAVGASTYVVSAGPTKYGSVVLPDADVISEMAPRGQVFRTDLNDATCGTNAAKIGPDADGKAGGCDNIRVVISAAGAIQVGYVPLAGIP